MEEENKKNKRKDQQLNAVWFAVATAAIMACLECAAAVSRWRVWVFLSLNLLLLAILFTSSSSPQTQSPSNQTVGEEGEAQDTAEKQRHIETVDRKKKKHCQVSIDPEIDHENHVMKKENSNQMSQEELNQRVEAFIAMFRQQYLVPRHDHAKV